MNFLIMIIVEVRLKVIIMAEIKLQFSVVCECSDGKNIGNIYNGFRPVEIDQFFIVNKWIWDDQLKAEFEVDDHFYQETRIISGESEVLAFSKSDLFRVKNSHTHNNYFKEIKFKEGADYRVEVKLFRAEGELVENGSLNYPIFVKKAK